MSDKAERYYRVEGGKQFCPKGSAYRGGKSGVIPSNEEMLVHMLKHPSADTPDLCFGGEHNIELTPRQLLCQINELERMRKEFKVKYGTEMHKYVVKDDMFTAGGVNAINNKYYALTHHDVYGCLFVEFEGVPLGRNISNDGDVVRPVKVLSVSNFDDEREKFRRLENFDHSITSHEYPELVKKAIDKDTPASELAKFARHHDYDVRQAVTWNKGKLPVTLIESMLRRFEPVLTEELVRRPETPVALIEEMAKVGTWETKYYAGEQLKKLKENRDL